jgi:hypothetical protein
MQLHGSFQELRQHDDSASTYLQKAKALFDELAAAGRPISLAEFNLYVFRGLRSEFKDLVTSLSTKADPSPTLISIAVYLHINFSTKLLSNQQ